MAKIKLLHCADLHLGSEISSLEDKAGERRGELLKTFRKIVNICENKNIDVLAIAGDLFEGSNVDPNTIASVKESLSYIKNTIVAISPGNHDYVSIDSPYMDEDWPENVIIFNSKLEKVEFPEKELCIWGAGFTSTYVNDSLLGEIQEVNDKYINLCVLHGEIVSNSQVSRYNPITENQLKNSNMDYVALGHIHKCSSILKAGSTSFAYSGCPEGRGFDELDEKGVYIGTLYKGNANMEFRKTGSRMFQALLIDITGLSSDLEIEKAVLNEIKNVYGKGYEENLYKVSLRGTVPEWYTPTIDFITQNLRDMVYYLKIYDETRVEVDFEELKKESSLKGIFVRKMMDKIELMKENNDYEGVQMLERALNIGIKAFEG